MKKFIIDIRSNVLIKIASVNSFAVAIRIIAGFLTSKAIAIYVGTEGMALVGNLRDFLSSVQSFSTLGFTNGIIKYVSEFKNKTIELSKTISTSFFVGIAATIIVSLIVFFFAEDLSDILFTTQNNYTFIFRLVALALPLYALNAFLLAILNGLSKFKKLLFINIVAQIVGMVMTLYLIWQHQLTGALIAVATVESLIIVVTIFGAYNQKQILNLIKWANLNFNSFKSLTSYSFMALFSALALPLVSVAIRNYIIDTQSLREAGLWEAMNRISGYYLMFVSTLLTVYLLPRFSEIQTKKEFRNEVFGFYKTIIPIFGLGLILIYFLRSFIIRLVLTEEFIEVQSLFFWQLSGDFIKVLSIVIAYQFLAKRMVIHYIVIEASSALIMYLASIYFIDSIGLVGVVKAHFVRYVIHFIVLLIIFNKSLFGSKLSTQ